ncbi:hypothetical protein PLESTM_000289500 [Pleodorina starrii]|nr:hypothetical protein PLESTM_000289500 [Pleodorina starrii]
MHRPCAAASHGSPDAAGQTPKLRQRQSKPSSAAASAGPRQRPTNTADTRVKAPTTSPATSSSTLPARIPRKAPPQHQPSQQPPTHPATTAATTEAPPPPPAVSATGTVVPSPDDAAASATPSQPPSAPPPASALSPEILQRYQLSAHQHRQLEIYLDYLLEVNQSMNLTAVRDKGDAWQRHVVDSLALLPVIERHIGGSDSSSGNSSKSRASSGSSDGSSSTGVGSGSEGEAQGGEGSRGQELRARSGEGASSSSSSDGGGGGRGRGALRVVDVGTGAGLPGMVLAVARPQWKVTLLDSLRKRCDFLREAAARAGLSNVEVVWCRAEDGGHRPELRQAYDLAVARAVAESRVLAELCLPFVRVGGLWVAAKGPDPEVEVCAAAGAIRQLGGRQLALERVESHSAEGQRTALVVAKAGPTPARFPRQAGTPNKKPL